MTLNKTIVLMAAVLAVVTVLAAGLVVLQGSVQEAQANPCSADAASSANGAVNGNNTGFIDTDDMNVRSNIGIENGCESYGDFEFNEAPNH
jgi:hypothetical protein